MKLLSKYLIIAALFLTTENVMHAQQNVRFNYGDPKEYVVADLKISGVEFLDKQVLANISGIRIGDVISVPGDDISRMIDKYWKQGLFSDIKVTVDSIAGRKIFLDVYLKERPRIASLTIEGVNKSDQEDLEEKMELRRGSQVTEELLNNTDLIIKNHFIEKGFFNVEVDFLQERDTTYANRVNLVIDIHKNDRVKINDIIFKGNQVFKEGKLRRVMKNTKKRNLNFFKASKYIEPDFKEDKASLIEFYNENGYRDAKIVDSRIEVLSEKRINLYIDIKEGDQYFFRNISWVGNTKYPDEILDNVLGIEKGNVYDQTLLMNRLQIEEDAVSSLYMDNGYLFSSIEPVEVNVENDSIDLEMRIYEGKQARIDQIIIKGNTKTNEHVIRRELRTKPGELFSRNDIIRTVRELAQLGHFNPENIVPNPIPNPEEGTVDIEYQLEEKANDQLEVSGGWGAGMFVGTIGLRFSNFAASRMLDPKAWRPVPSGDGQTLSLRAQTNGKYYQSYNATFVEPWFGGKKPNSFSVSLFHSKVNKSSGFSYYGYIRNPRDIPDEYMKITGGSIGLGRRLSWPDDYFTLYNEISLQRYRLKDYYDYFRVTDEIALNHGTFHSFAFKTTFGRSSQDQPIYPRRGSNFSLSLEITPPYSWFKEDGFYRLSPAEKETIRGIVEAENLNATEKQLAGLQEDRILRNELAEKYKLLEHHKWTFKSAWYNRIIGDLVLMTKADFGFKGYFSKDIGPSPFEGYMVGGDGMGYGRFGVETIGLRGYENYSLTEYPYYNSSGSQGSRTRYANIYNKYTIELRYPFTLSPSASIYGLAFLEGGNVWYDLNEFNPFIIRRSAGVGVRAFLPMFGMLGIDWGYGFDETPIPGNNGGQFHFVLGQQF